MRWGGTGVVVEQELYKPTSIKTRLQQLRHSRALQFQFIFIAGKTLTRYRHLNIQAVAYQPMTIPVK